MRIAIVTHKFVRGEGQGRVNVEVALEALRRGHALVLLASHIDYDLREHPNVTWVPIHDERWPIQFFRDFMFARESNRWLRTYSQDYDILKVNGAIAGCGGDVNAVHFVHAAWAKSPYQKIEDVSGPTAWYRRVYSWLNSRRERAAFNQSDRLVAVSHLVSDQLQELGYPSSAISVITNGVDTDQFCPGPSSNDLLAQAHGRTTLLYAGDIRTSLKNLDTILTTMVDLPDVHLFVAGETAGSPYPSRVRDLGIKSRVTFLGYRTDLPELMRSVDLFVLVSRYDPFSLVILEAMASGTPVITASTVGAADLVTPDCGAVLNDPNDSNGLRSAIRRITENPETLRSMGCAAREIAEAHRFTEMAVRYVDLLEDVHANKQAGISAAPAF